MIIEKDLRNLFNQLVHRDTARINLGGSDILVKLYDQSSKIFLSTPVYIGDNYIPKSVRACLLQKAPFDDRNLITHLSIDENLFQITLNFQGNVDHLDNQLFKDLLEEFNWLADEWRFFLDEHDKNDLVYVRHP